MTSSRSFMAGRTSSWDCPDGHSAGNPHAGAVVGYTITGSPLTVGDLYQSARDELNLPVETRAKAKKPSNVSTAQRAQ